MRRLTELQIEDFKKISFVNIELHPGVTEISGPNGAGKSTSLDAIAVLFDGLKVAPAEPIRKGATLTRIRGRLGEMYVERVIQRAKGGKGELTTKITLKPVEGKAYPSTQRQLYDLIGEHNLDAGDFLKLDARAKFDAFRAFVPGFDFDTAAKEDSGDYTRRTECNRQAKEARAAAGLIFVAPGTPADAVPVAELETELDAAHKKNLAESERKSRREAGELKVAELKASAANFESQIATDRDARASQRDLAIAGIDEQIAALQRQRITVAQQWLENMERCAAEFSEKAAAALREADALQTRLDAGAAIAPPIDTDAIKKKIDAARVTNANVERAAQKKRHNNTAERYERESEELTASMAAREKAKRDAIAAAKLPVAGIEFGNGELLLDGLPFDQASTAQRLRVGVALAVARRPDLRLVWIRDASLLDDTTYAGLDPLSKEFDCDILLETVRPIGQNVVVLENGHVKDGPISAPEAEAAGAAA